MQNSFANMQGANAPMRARAVFRGAPSGYNSTLFKFKDTLERDTFVKAKVPTPLNTPLKQDIQAQAPKSADYMSAIKNAMLQMFTNTSNASPNKMSAAV